MLAETLDEGVLIKARASQLVTCAFDKDVQTRCKSASERKKMEVEAIMQAGGRLLPIVSIA